MTLQFIDVLGSVRSRRPFRAFKKLVVNLAPITAGYALRHKEKLLLYSRRPMFKLPAAVIHSGRAVVVLRAKLGAPRRGAVDTGRIAGLSWRNTL